MGLIAADFFGKVHCLNAQSGAHYWTQNLNARVWSTPLIVDHRIYVGTEEGEVWILRLAPEKSPAITLEFDSPLRASPVFANGTLYIATDQRLHAIRAASP